MDVNVNVNKQNNEVKKKKIERIQDYGYYSRVLNKPFDSIEELRAAESEHYAEIKAKEDKVAAKKADAQKVEDAFKAMNAARKVYKENLAQLTTEYTNALTELRKTYEHGANDIREKMAAAENAYKTALKEFTDKYDSYHLSLKDGDFETTIESNRSVKQNATNSTVKSNSLLDLFDLFFNI